jgi:hypothetical protein
LPITNPADQLNDDVVICTNQDPTTHAWSPAGCTGNFLPDGSFSNKDDVSIARFTNYVDGCSDGMKNFFFDGGENSNALFPNTATGWCIQVFGTYFGFIIMFVGVCQATMLHLKIVNKWHEIRGTH